MPPLTQEQLAKRLYGLGSSDVGGVVGESPYATPHGVWLEKRGLVEPFAGNDATWLGNEMEPIIAKRYTMDTGVELVNGPGTISHPQHDWVLATTDREYVDGSRIVECKHVGQRTSFHWTLDADGAPPYVITQSTWQMLAREIRRCDVAVIFGGTAQFRIYEIHYDEALADALLKIAGKFWRDHVLAGVAPPIDGSEDARRVLAALYPRSRQPLKPAPREAAEWCERRQSAVDAGKAAERERDLATNKLIEIIGDAEGIEGPWGVVTYKSSKAGVRSIRMYPRKERAA